MTFNEDAELARARQMFTTMIPEPNPTIEERRRGFEGMLAKFEIPADAQITKASIGGVPCFRVRAPEASSSRIVIFTHGGGFVMGSAEGYREFAYNVSKASGAEVIAVEYRLAPEHPAPGAVDDTVSVYRELLKEVPSSNIVLLGDSAGGGVALGALLRIRDSEDLDKPAAAVAMSPVTDLRARHDSYDYNSNLDPLVTRANITRQGGMYGDHLSEQEWPYASVIDADLHGLPPIFMMVGDEETLFEDTMNFYLKLRRSGGQGRLLVEPKMIHVWPMFASFLPQAVRSLELVGEFIDQHVGAEGAVTR